MIRRRRRARWRSCWPDTAGQGQHDSIQSVPGTQYRRSSDAAIWRFRDELLKRGVMATVRRTRGDDIDAACGQLVGRVQDRTTARLGARVRA
jgi:hypothetical protein